MSACVACGCTNRPSKKKPGLSFHKFPKNAQQQKAWVKACRRANWSPTQFSSLCSEHFSEDQIDRTSLSYVRLRENAIPNIFKDFPLYFKNGKKRKKVPIVRNVPVTSTKRKKIPKPRKILDDMPEVDEVLPSTPEVQTFNFKRNGTYYTFYEDKHSALKKTARTELKNVEDSNQDLVAELEKSVSDAESTNTEFVGELEETVSFAETTNTEFVDESGESLPQSNNAVSSDDLEENVLGLEPTNNCAAVSEENESVLETFNEENAKLEGNRSVIATNNIYSLPMPSSTSGTQYEHTPSPERISITEALESKVKEYEGMISFYNKKIEMLHLEAHKFKSKIEKMSSLYEELKHKQLTETEAMEMLSRSTGLTEQFLVWKLSKIKNEIVPNEDVPNDDPEESKPFDLTLHFYSPKTYEYVRDTFQTHLPYTVK